MGCLISDRVRYKHPMTNILTCGLGSLPRNARLPDVILIAPAATIAGRSVYGRQNPPESRGASESHSDRGPAVEPHDGTVGPGHAARSRLGPPNPGFRPRPNPLKPVPMGDQSTPAQHSRRGFLLTCQAGFCPPTHGCPAIGAVAPRNHFGSGGSGSTGSQGRYDASSYFRFSASW